MSPVEMMEDDEDDEVDDDDDDDDASPGDVMDERAAAMVLTSLSISPASPPMLNSFSFHERGNLQ